MKRTPSQWEAVFGAWSQGPGKTESDKAENAETAIRKAIKASEPLKNLDITVFAQGSYRNRTNVRQESDVDICVRLSEQSIPRHLTIQIRLSVSSSPSAFINATCTVLNSATPHPALLSLMLQPKEDRDLTTERLLVLNIRLMECLLEAGIVRIRLLKARDANVWPTLRSPLHSSVSDKVH